MRDKAFHKVSVRPILHLLLILVFIIPLKSYSQKPDREQTLAFLNKLGGDTIRFSLKGMMLGISSVRGATLIREDKVLLTDLDTVAVYEQESGLICVNCLPDVPGCVTRSLEIQKIRRTRGRTTIPVTEEAAESARLAIQHLIKLTTVKKYRDEIELPEN